MSSYRKTMRQAREEMLAINEAKYDLYHKDFSSAMQHAYKMAKKLHGITVDSKEIDDKVASGPRKPSEGKTNKYRLKGDKGAIQVQVYNKGGPKPFELNMYKEEVEVDEAKMTFGTKRIPAAMKKKGMDKVKTKGLNKDKSSAAYIGKMKKEEVELDEGKAPDVKKGDVIIVSKSKRPYKMGGMVDPKTTLPAESDKMVVKKVTKSKDGRKAHLTHHDPKKRGGYAIYLDKMPDFMSVKIAEEVELDEKYDSDKFFSGKGTPEQRLQLLKLQNKALRALGGSPKQKAIKKEIDALRKKMGMKVKEEIELDERNYKKEYANYQGKPEQIERRSSRNKARRVMGDKTKIGMDVGHKDNNPMNNNPENLKNEDPSKNRREPRLREMDEDVYDTFPWLKKAKDYLFTKTHKKGMNKVALSVATEFAKQQKAGKNPNPINIIHDVSKGIIGVTDRMVVTYINDLIKKGKLPKDLRAEYEPQNETMSFKDFVNQIQEVKQDPDIKDKKGTQPAKYYAGDMAKSTKDKRDAHFRKKKSGPAPGDADAKTKPSVHTKKFKQMFGEVLPDNATQKDYIDDFEKSDAPQFQGKSKEKRREMAIAAYLSKNEDGPCWDTHKQVGMKKKSGRMVPNCVPKNEEPRIPRKKGQPAGSDKHSDLYTDENPVGTIQGLGFKDVKTAKASVKKIIGSGKTHAHKIQAAIAMEQRAKEMGKTAEASIYRTYIDKMKKKTKEMQKEDAEDDRLQKTIKVATAKANLGKKLKQMKVQQKTSLKNIRDKDQKKARSDVMKQQIKRLKDSGKRDIKQIQKEETELNEWGEVTEKAPDTSDAMKRYKSGKAGFTDIAHLKAKGLIKRADGEKKKSAKYEDACCEECETESLIIKENIYRVGSEAYFQYFVDIREKFNTGDLYYRGFDKRLMEGDIGKFAIYEGKYVPLECPMMEAEYQGKEVELNSPKAGGPKKYYVYVKDPSTGNVKKVSWGDTTGLKIKLDDKEARKSFAARHKCDQKTDKTKAGYWACNMPRYAKQLGLSGGGNFFW